jgi:hypothetical protein
MIDIDSARLIAMAIAAGFGVAGPAIGIGLIGFGAMQAICDRIRRGARYPRTRRFLHYQVRLARPCVPYHG